VFIFWVGLPFCEIFGFDGQKVAATFCPPRTPGPRHTHTTRPKAGSVVSSAGVPIFEFVLCPVSSLLPLLTGIACFRFCCLICFLFLFAVCCLLLCVCVFPSVLARAARLLLSVSVCEQISLFSLMFVGKEKREKRKTDKSR
jgi:hypothetical protein